ncbi:acetyltransferase [Dehalobacter sp. DCM]|uniref:acetyltransferase n=1 Tax=Dehalobacter sp. DCM TaxID=2907827 RepID=UPI0030814465|nr:acetyltransferase [Dehalobacter sp. DCM]
MEKIVLVGAGGHALSVIDSIHAAGKYEIVGITALDYIGKKLLGYEILGTDAVLQSVFESGIKHAFIAVGSIGNPALRENLFFRLKRQGFILPAIIDPSATIGSDVRLSEGIYAGRNTIINAKSAIGDMAIINTGAILEHNCRMQEFTHIGPGAVICGDVNIGARTHIGANATVIQGVTIGDDCLIGAGSVVVRDVQDKVVAYGNPCKAARKNA